MNASGLACRIRGPEHAPVVVLLHALATHSELWRPQWAVWSTVFKLVAIDLPGHGASPAPAAPLRMDGYAARVGAALDELGVQRAAVVGLSLGGMVAQAMALRDAARIRALVLAHTTARTPGAVRELWAQRLAQFERDGLEAQVQPTLARWFTADFARDHPMTMEWVARQIRSTTPAGYATAIGAIQDLDHFDRLGEIALPTLVVAGDSDLAVPPQSASAMVDRLPRAELLMLADAAHLGNVQQPLAFTEVVGRFLTRSLAD
jgi:3-oxoadipate enol-lactonase